MVSPGSLSAGSSAAVLLSGALLSAALLSGALLSAAEPDPPGMLHAVRAAAAVRARAAQRVRVRFIRVLLLWSCLGVKNREAPAEYPQHTMFCGEKQRKNTFLREKRTHARAVLPPGHARLSKRLKIRCQRRTCAAYSS